VRVRQYQLDFLRGVAATYVVINHSRGDFFVGGQRLLAHHHPGILDYLTILLLQATSLGTEMVILFFVLSGFAMAHSVSRTSSVPMFYAKRVIRIWPPYLAATLLAFAVASIVGFQFPLLQVAFYVHPETRVTGQFWSLPYEVVFYALCPLVVAGRRNSTLFAILASLGLLLTVALKGLSLNPWGQHFFLNFFGNEMFFFACGAMAYWYFDRIPMVSHRTLGLVVAGAFVLTAVLKFVLSAVFRLAIGDSNILCTLVVIAATILTLRNIPEKLPKWANFGSFSYSIYIYHFALIVLFSWSLSRFGIESTTIRNPFIWMLVPPPLIGCCYLLYLVTEKPCNRIVASLRKRRSEAVEERVNLVVPARSQASAPNS
jgi:peptidoglycan/LPS O-acetylase OafA/YrhL